MTSHQKPGNTPVVSGDPRRPYPTDLEMRSGMLGHMANLPTNGVNGHLPGDALAAGRLPGTPEETHLLSFPPGVIICYVPKMWTQ